MEVRGVRLSRLPVPVTQLLAVASIGVQAMAAMVFAILTARWLGPEERGAIVVTVAVGTILMLIGSLGTATVLRVDVAKNPSAAAHILAVIKPLQYVHIATSLIVGVVVFSIVGGLTTATIALFVVYCGLVLRAYWGREILHGIGRHQSAMLLEAAGVAMQILLILTVYSIGYLSLPICMATMNLGLALQIWFQYQILCRADVPKGVRVLTGDHQELRPLVRRSLPALGAAVGQSITLRGDRILLGIMGSTFAVGVYGGAASLVETLSLISLGVSQLLFRSASIGRLSHLKVIRWATLLSIAIGTLALYAIAPWLIDMLLGKSYESATELIPLLGLATMFLGSYYIDMAVLNGLGAYGSVARWTVAASVVLVASCVALIPLFGSQGAAAGTLAAYAVMATGVRIAVRRKDLAR